MNIILCAIEPRLADAWSKHCGELEFVTVHQGSILDVDCDAMVSPANSFGFMDGGIDALYMDHFGDEIQMRVRRQIFDHHDGELIVGNADIVETAHPKTPYLVVAPTMRVPMVLQDSVNPYLAARAVFLLVRKASFILGRYQGERISAHVQTIAIPGLGTGTGRIPFDTCARQVRAAINDVVLGQYRMPQSWAEASERHQLLYTDSPKPIQRIWV